MLKHTIILTVVAVTLMAITLFFGYANAKEPDEGGLSGFIAIGGGVDIGKSSLDDASDDDNDLIYSLSQSAKSETRFEAVLYGELTYTLAESGTSFTLSSMENPIELSVSQKIGSFGSISLGAAYNEEEVYADPFQTGVVRGKTDMSAKIFSIDLDDIMETGIWVGYTHEIIDLDNDLAGLRNADLRREGKVHTISAGAPIFSTEAHELSAMLSYTDGSFEGKSNDYCGYALGLSHTYTAGQWELETFAEAVLRDYDNSHPEFSKTREDREYTVGSIVTWFDPFGMTDYFIAGMAAYTAVDSNIKFYDESHAVMELAVGYRF